VVGAPTPRKLYGSFAAVVDQRGNPMTEVSLVRLYALRLAYLILGGGLVLVKWPTLISHDPQWPLWEGVSSSLLGALALMAILGLRYPLQMLPFLLFEFAWKIIWGGLVFLPLWQSGEVTAGAASVAVNCLVVLVLIPLIPWRYVVTTYVLSPGAPWRADIGKAHSVAAPLNGN
jgi:hypothetical protein